MGSVGPSAPRYRIAASRTDGSARPAVEEAAERLDSLPQVWAEATPDVRRSLAALVVHVYVDVDARPIAGIDPVAALRALLGLALRSVSIGAARLVSPGWWSVVEMGGLEPPAFALRTRRSPS